MIESHELIVDLFAGGGGASTGIEAALGRSVDIAVNHDPVAIAVHAANHPATQHLTKGVFEIDPIEATGGKPVGFLWASPDCKHFSIAKGDVPRDNGIRSLAWVVVDWAKTVRPRIICLENVREFQDWGPLDESGKPDKSRKGETFRQWVQSIRDLGYDIEWQALDASRFGAPTKRIRLFVVARCDGQPIRWPAPTHGKGLVPFRAAAECIDWSLNCLSIFDRAKPLAEKTLKRIAQGIDRYVINNPTPLIVPASPGLSDRRDLVTAFIIKHYGGVVGHDLNRQLGTVTATDHHSLTVACLAKFRGTGANQPMSASAEHPLSTISAGGTHVAEVRAFLTAYYGFETAGQSIDRPIRTITSKDRMGLVIVKGSPYQIIDIGMRMLSPKELLRAQFGAFASAYDLSAAKTKTAKVRLIGNSVCPEVAKALIEAQFGSEPTQLKLAA